MTVLQPGREEDRQLRLAFWCGELDQAQRCHGGGSRRITVLALD